MKNLKLNMAMLGISCVLVAGCSDDNDGASAPSPDVSAPSITADSQQVFADSSANRVAIDVSDDRSDLESIQLSVTSNDTSLFSDANIAIVNSGSNVELLITPEEDVVGSAELVISATDEASNQSQSTLVVEILPNEKLSSVLMELLLDTGEDQEPTGVNGLEVLEDIDAEEWFDSLFEA